jgi:hypothetical protein
MVYKGSRKFSKNVGISDVRFLFTYGKYCYGYYIPNKEARVFFYRARTSDGVKMSYLTRINALTFVTYLDKYVREKET